MLNRGPSECISSDGMSDPSLLNGATGALPDDSVADSGASLFLVSNSILPGSHMTRGSDSLPPLGLISPADCGAEHGGSLGVFQEVGQLPHCHQYQVHNHNAASASGASASPYMVPPSTIRIQSHIAQPTIASEAGGSSRDAQCSEQSHPFSFTSHGVAYEELQQTIYDRGLASEAFQLPDMQFQGISLGDAHRHEFSCLQDHDQGAWPVSWIGEVPQKLAIVFCFPGYPKYSRQVNVLRHVRSRPLPPIRSKLAHIIATEMQTFLRSAHSTGKPLVYGNRQLSLDDLVLVNIQHISRGSLQPTIGVIIRRTNATTVD